MHYLTSINVSAYSSASQKIRILSESWVGKTIFCPSCNSYLSPAKNNSKACDFKCPKCFEEFELKSKRDRIGNKVVDGAYTTLTERIKSDNNPNLYLLQYNKVNYCVENFLVIPRYFFTPAIIESRKPLSPTARRAGWTGCNIIVGQIPEAGKIFYIRDKKDVDRKTVLKSWRSTQFLKHNFSVESKGWLLDTMSCIDKIGANEFTLDKLYEFESQLKFKHPSNSRIKEKLRQQLQILRDRGYIEFVSRGRYRVNKHYAE